eukprot:CAMPEP_0184322802 /NCGR_PEP_ID=MMETSP1049-20130417/126617_1 /TAXON_ID=77928 /ORGANISM="Proteomonas sulcata, Strain CCMP704" /LENGTH=38 /DNA_ID= /DNA_START= /DNA_END= /DNA_ORIENTATION=
MPPKVPIPMTPNAVNSILFLNPSVSWQKALPVCRGGMT